MSRESAAGRVNEQSPAAGAFHPQSCGTPAIWLEGERVLSETPGDFGLLLWRTVRDVTLWADTPQNQRGSLFVEGSVDRRIALLAAADIPPEVSAVVDTLNGMLTLSGRADASIITLCCLEIAAWARRAGLPHTAIAFAQAAALASPDVAEAALLTGAYARLAGQVSRAGTWLRRSLTLARRERDGAAYSAALVELGALYEERGQLERASSYYRSAFRAGRRMSARGARMRAAHGLLRLALRQGDPATAAQFALAAQSAYEADAQGGPDLLLDLARFWISLGERSRARAALGRLWPTLSKLPRSSRLIALALTARVRAEPGHLRKGASAARAAWALIADADIAEPIRWSAALDLAHAARTAGDLVAFTQAKRAILLLTPQAEFPAVATELEQMWPNMDAGIERAS